MARITLGGKGATERRTNVREEYWPTDAAWMGSDDKGYFNAPRSLPLVLRALSSKKVSKGKDPSGVYLELMSRHWDSGVVEMTHEEDHAFGAGYSSGNATKTWRERMRLLEELGFIKSKGSGLRPYANVLLIHPSVAMQGLRDRGLIPDELWNAYREVQRTSKERTAEEIVPKTAPEELPDGAKTAG